MTATKHCERCARLMHDPDDALAKDPWAAVADYGRFLMERTADPHMREKIATALIGKAVNH